MNRSSVCSQACSDEVQLSEKDLAVFFSRVALFSVQTVVTAVSFVCVYCCHDNDLHITQGGKRPDSRTAGLPMVTVLFTA